jgi:hypothetical protein
MWKLSGRSVGLKIAHIEETWIEEAAKSSIIILYTRDHLLSSLALDDTTTLQRSLSITAIAYHTWFNFTQSTSASGSGRSICET